MPRGSSCFSLTLDGIKQRYARFPLDILFLFDSSASMRDMLEAVRQEAREIMRFIRGLSEESTFGVAAFNDYPEVTQDRSSYPWRLYQDLTPDPDAVGSALARVEEGYGGDLPEAYNRALHEAQGLNWRPNARKYIVLFGDAPGKDPDFFGVNTGIDPGRDALFGTADDLRFRDVVRQLAEREIRVIAIHDTRFGDKEKRLLDLAIKGFEFMADETGGVVKPIGAPGQAGNAIREAILEQSVSAIKLDAGPRYGGWVEIGSPRFDGTDDSGIAYPVCVRPPEKTVSGVYRFPIRVIENTEAGTHELGTTAVTVHLGWWSHPVGRALLVALAPVVVILAPVLFLLAGTRRPRQRHIGSGYHWVVVARTLAVIVLLASFVWWMVG